MRMRYRRGRPEDLRQGWRSVAAERELFTKRTYACLPHLLADLVARERIHLCAFEEHESGHVVRLGGFALLNAHFLRIALTHSRMSILEQALLSEWHHQPALLNRREVAVANRHGTLDMLCFFATPDFDEPMCVDAISLTYEAWRFFLRGYQLQKIWREYTTPSASATLDAVGFRHVRTVAAESNQSAVLSCINRSAAFETPGLTLASVMTSPRPIFQLSTPEQILLEHALLDLSDREIAQQLRITRDAIKKRWRSIYVKVAAKEPWIFRNGLGGADRRRALLRRMRHSLEELRPYSTCVKMKPPCGSHDEARVE